MAIHIKFIHSDMTVFRIYFLSI